jgi:hypothetical protein
VVALILLGFASMPLVDAIEVLRWFRELLSVKTHFVEGC